MANLILCYSGRFECSCLHVHWSPAGSNHDLFDISYSRASHIQTWKYVQYIKISVLQAIICHRVVPCIHLSAYVKYRPNLLPGPCSYHYQWYLRSMMHQSLRFMGVRITVNEVLFWSKQSLHLWHCMWNILMAKHQAISRKTKIECSHSNDRIACSAACPVRERTVSSIRYCTLVNNQYSHWTVQRLKKPCMGNASNLYKIHLNLLLSDSFRGLYTKRVIQVKLCSIWCEKQLQIHFDVLVPCVKYRKWNGRRRV